MENEQKAKIICFVQVVSTTLTVDMMNVKHQTERFFEHLMNTSLVLMVWSPPAAWIGCWSLYRHLRITTASEPDLCPTSCDMKEAILPGLVL